MFKSEVISFEIYCQTDKSHTSGQLALPVH